MTAIEPAKRPLPAPSLEEDYALLKTGRARSRASSRSTYFRKSITVKRKIDGSEVSEADLAVDVALKLGLHVPRPTMAGCRRRARTTPSGSTAAGCGRSIRSTAPMPSCVTCRNGRSRRRWSRTACRCSAWCSIPPPMSSSTPCAGKGAFLNDEPIMASTQEHARRRAADRQRRPVQEEDLEGAVARGADQMGELGGLPAGAGRLRPGRRHHLALGQERMGSRRRARSSSRKRAASSPIITARRTATTAPSPRLPSLVASGKALHPLLIERTDRVDL